MVCSPPMGRTCTAPVVGVESYGNENFLLAVEAPEMARECRPGQFVMAAEASGADYPFPLLKRALAVYSRRYREHSGTVLTLLLKVVGDGTRRLASLRSGDRVDLIGPLGNGFSLDEARGKTSFLVAGGIGIASFLLFAEQIVAAGEKAILVYGARTSADLIGIEDFERLGMPAYAATEDGSRGTRGLVTAALEKAAAERPGEAIAFTCGPTPMMEAVTKWCRRRSIPCRISVENRMACGFGVCLGCTVKTDEGYRLACTHGPVFDAEGFIFSDMGEEGAPR